MTVDRGGALDHDIARLRSGLDVMPPGHPDRAQRLADLALLFRTRFVSTGDLGDLDAQISYLREAVAALPHGHRDRPTLRRALADALTLRFERTHDPDDREAADAYGREADVDTTTGRDRLALGYPDVGARPAPWAEEPRTEPSLADEPPTSAPPASAPPAAPPVGGKPPTDPWPDAPLVTDRARSGAWHQDAPIPAQRAPGALPSVGTRPVARRDARTEGSVTARRLEFAAAYERSIEHGRSYPFLFVVHRPADRDAVRALIERRAPQLGGAPAVSAAEATKEVRSGTTLTIVPTILGVSFEPSRIEIIVGDTIRELTFRATAAREHEPGPLDGNIDIFAGPLLVGQVPVAFEVRSAGAAPVPSPGAKLMEVASASIFDKIFVSYSHNDSTVVDRCVAIYQGLGVTVLLDRLGLRSGDDWRATLIGMIDDADIFQLYWSAAAAASSEVQREWGLALGLSKIRDHGNFIRPLYWETPLPTIPEALGHLHFSWIDPKQVRKAAKAYDAPGLLRRALTALRLR